VVAFFIAPSLTTDPQLQSPTPAVGVHQDDVVPQSFVERDGVVVPAAPFALGQSDV
jgi:hypothetical protein